MTNDHVLYGQTTLGRGIRSRLVENGNGVVLHLLESGDPSPNQPCVVLLHGFPELAYSWRRVMLPLADAGFHVVAPDQRGYGRSDGAGVTYADPLGPFTILNRVRDTLGLVLALGHRTVAAVVGHDYGSPVAAWCSLVRPDIFESVALMSAPFGGAPTLPFDVATAGNSRRAAQGIDVNAELAALNSPRKHYQHYYATPSANEEMWHCPQGVHQFLRAYFHMKSADWLGNHPEPLASWTASELAKMPRYYVMDAAKTMAETVAEEMPTATEIAACEWLPEEELRVYSDEYARTGFQGGLESYRVGLIQEYEAELRLFSGRIIDVPACFIAGESDWGIHQRPGRFETMSTEACTQWRGTFLVPGAGHWVQQERSEEVARLLAQFLGV